MPKMLKKYVGCKSLRDMNGFRHAILERHDVIKDGSIQVTIIHETWNTESPPKRVWFQEMIMPTIVK
jgi:hypothetical protein